VNSIIKINNQNFNEEKKLYERINRKYTVGNAAAEIGENRTGVISQHKKISRFNKRVRLWLSVGHKFIFGSICPFYGRFELFNFKYLGVK